LPVASQNTVEFSKLPSYFIFGSKLLLTQSSINISGATPETCRYTTVCSIRQLCAARRDAVVYAVGPRLSVCPSATSRYCTKVARRITQTTPHDSRPRTVVFDAKNIWVIRMRSPQRGRQTPVRKVKISDFGPIYRYMSETMQGSDRPTVTSEG